MALLYGDDGSWKMWSAVATSAEAHTRFGDWWVAVSGMARACAQIACSRSHFRRYGDVEMQTGRVTRPIFDSLMGFWPGLLALVGDLPAAGRTLGAFLSVQRSLGAPGVPEEFDYLRWQLPSKNSGGRKWLLRPEVTESLLHLHRASGDDSWAWAGAATLDALEKLTSPRESSLGCGFAALQDVSCVHACMQKKKA